MASKYVQVYTDLKKKIENRELEIGTGSSCGSRADEPVSGVTGYHTQVSGNPGESGIYSESQRQGGNSCRQGELYISF